MRAGYRVGRTELIMLYEHLWEMYVEMSDSEGLDSRILRSSFLSVGYCHASPKPFLYY